MLKYIKWLKPTVKKYGWALSVIVALFYFFAECLEVGATRAATFIFLLIEFFGISLPFYFLKKDEEEK